MGRPGMAAELSRWAAILDECGLDVPEMALAIDFTHRRCYGHFRPGHNGFGPQGEILINRHYLSSRPGWQTLGTLLHELLHGWRRAHGRPGEGRYRQQAVPPEGRVAGIDRRSHGHTRYAADSPCVRLLEKHGMHLPSFGEPAIPVRQPGQSKLKKWSCGCTNVRVAVADFRALCLKCGGEFTPASSVGPLRHDRRAVLRF